MSYNRDSFHLGLAIKNACLCNLIFLLFLFVVEPLLVLRSEVFLWTYLQDKHSRKILHIFLPITKKQVRGEMEQPKSNCLITFNGLADYFLQQKQSICGYNIFKVMNTYFIIKIWHICFFNISCHKQSLAFSSHGKGLLDLKNIGDIWVHWNMAAFGHVSWFYDAVPFHPSLLQFHFTPCKKNN